MAYFGNGKTQSEEIGTIRWTQWLTTGGANSAWALHHAPQMTRFVRDLIERFQPRFIIVRHRKGERVFAVLKLIPTEYLPIVFELDFFLLMPSDHARDLLTNATVLILDDTCQKGRHANWMRSQLEGLEPTVKVITACLFCSVYLEPRGS